MPTTPTFLQETLDPGTNVLVTVASDVDMREVFLQSIADPGTEDGAVILLATAESGHSLFDDCKDLLTVAEQETLQVIDASVRIPDDVGESQANNIRYVPPVSEYLAQLGDEFSRALDDLQTEIGENEELLDNRVGFYSLGPLLDFAADAELVFRFVCILVNQIEDAGGHGIFFVDSSYGRDVERLEILFDKRVFVDRTADGEIDYRIASAL